MSGIIEKLARRTLVSVLFAVMLSTPARSQEPELPPALPPPASLEIANVPEIPEHIATGLARYRKIGSSVFLDWAPTSEAMLVSSTIEEIAQLQFITRPRGRPLQITYSPDPIENGIFRPGSADILFSRDLQGTEEFDLFLVKSRTSEIISVTAGGGRNINPVFSPDGSRLVWSHADAGSADFSIVLAPLSDPAQQRVIYHGSGYWVPTDFSPDGKYLALRNQRDRSDVDLYLLDLASGVTTQIDFDPKPRGRSEAKFSTDGTTLYFLRDDDSEFNNLYGYVLATGKKRNFTADLEREIDAFDISPNGRRVVLSCNENGASQLRLIQTGSGQSLPVPRLGGGVVNRIAFSPDSKRIAISYSASLAPENVFVFGAGRRSLRRWTSTTLKELNSREFVEPQSFTYPGFDETDKGRRRISGFLYRPPGRGPHPVVIYFHGGPAFQFRPRFNSMFQYWVNDLGIAVVAPNVRGSSGYGRTFEQLDNGRGRADSMRDVEALLDWIATQKYLDANHIGTYGTSYGGYLSLATMMHYNDRVAGAAEMSGISNIATFLDNTATWRRDLRRQEYGDERDPAMRAWLQATAPVNHVDKFTKPLLIIHGRNDTRVPVTEALQMYDGVRKQGGLPWLIIANDEGHGLRRKSNSDFSDAAVALFFETILLGEDSPEKDDK